MILSPFSMDDLEGGLFDFSRDHEREADAARLREIVEFLSRVNRWLEETLHMQEVDFLTAQRMRVELKRIDAFSLELIGAFRRNAKRMGRSVPLFPKLRDDLIKENGHYLDFSAYIATCCSRLGNGDQDVYDLFLMMTTGQIREFIKETIHQLVETQRDIWRWLRGCSPTPPPTPEQPLAS